MENELKAKLQVVLEKDNLEETDVVYILSRIRKLLEVNKDKGCFKILNFYCNWALHAQIDDVDAVSNILTSSSDLGVVELIHNYSQFDEEFERFLKEYRLSTKIFQDNSLLHKFHYLLSNIYSDTPLILKTTTKDKITFKKIDAWGENSGSFSATSERIQ